MVLHVISTRFSKVLSVCPCTLFTFVLGNKDSPFKFIQKLVLSLNFYTSVYSPGACFLVLVVQEILFLGGGYETAAMLIHPAVQMYYKNWADNTEWSLQDKQRRRTLLRTHRFFYHSLVARALLLNGVDVSSLLYTCHQISHETNTKS